MHHLGVFVFMMFLVVAFLFVFSADKKG